MGAMPVTPHIIDFTKHEWPVLNPGLSRNLETNVVGNLCESARHLQGLGYGPDSPWTINRELVIRKN